jgi:hypothetical protein
MERGPTRAVGCVGWLGRAPLRPNRGEPRPAVGPVRSRLICPLRKTSRSVLKWWELNQICFTVGRVRKGKTGPITTILRQVECGRWHRETPQRTTAYTLVQG